MGQRPVRGRDLPLFAIVGGLGTALSFVVVTVLNPDVAIAGTAWLAIGIVAYVVYRRRQGLDLLSTAKVAVPQPVTEHEAEYDSVLVAYDHAHFVPDVVATAVKLAARRRRGIHVLVTIIVPASSPIDADLPEQELAAQTIIEQAKLARRPARVGPLREGPRRAGGPAHRQRGARDARGGDRPAAAAAAREDAVRARRSRPCSRTGRAA